eukprot:gene7675-9443_t
MGDHDNNNTEGYEEEEHNDQYEGGGYDDYYNTFEPMWVRAIYDYEAANDTEISFKENDMVCITQDYEDGWWCGDLNGVVGRVPANYFEYLDQEQGITDDTYNNQQEGYYDDQQQGYYDDQQHQQGYDDDGQQQYYDQQYDQQQQYYDDQNQGQQQDQDQEEMERKEKLRKQREMYKKEMKELQDKLKSQNESKEQMGMEIESLEKERDSLEDDIRILRLLKFINLEIIKTEIDIDSDSDISSHARQMGVGITQDIKSLRTIVGGIKSSSVTDQPKKQFDQKLEEIEQRFLTSLQKLDLCDYLKKSLFLSLTLFQSLVTPPLNPPPQPPTTSSSLYPSLSSPNQPTPPGGVSLYPPINSGGQQQPQQPPPPSIPPNQFIPVAPSTSTPNPFFSSPATVILSDKDKRKSMKEAKKMEKQEKKEEKRLEKQEKKEEKRLEKEKKKDDVSPPETSPLWKNNPKK